ncbi:MAG: hypothetical protein QOH48_1112 [Actinomycetota bacterium]|nr:hypothetical protein [Actinomycetota bacterium]
MDRFRRIGIIVGALVLAAWAIGCTSGSGGNASSGSSFKAAAPAPAVGAGSTVKGDLKGAPSGLPSSGTGSNGVNLQADAAIPQIGPKVIKTADVNVTLGRGKFQAGLQQAVQIAGRYQGFVLSTTTGSFGPRTSTVVMRVPASRFEAALADLKGLGRVTREDVSGQDVSQQFIDLQARLGNSKAQEVVLLRLMNRARSVSATIQVEQHLEGVQLQIERLKGELRYLGSQTSMSTITVGLSQAGVVAHQESSIEKAWRQAGAAFLAVVSSVIVGAAYLLPIGLLVLLGLWLVRWWRPRVSA